MDLFDSQHADELATLLALSDAGSFAAAGRALLRHPSVLSKRLNALERRLGVRLVERTTRQLQLTHAGLQLVEKVREATRLAREQNPQLLIDGPLQYDAAAIASVGRQKAPNSQVAGRATVFVFPDLNTGNTTYKAVQRSADCVSVGPMLQGLRKPVNDLSRGALVDDIVFTIALTAIQAASREV